MPFLACTIPLAVSLSEDHALSLGKSRRGFKGRVCRVESLENPELSQRLAEMGFVEGACVEIKHEGLFGRDPIAVRVGNATVALRRREASTVWVERAS